MKVILRLLLLIACTATIYAADRPDLDYVFDRFESNRRLYTAYNERVHRPEDRDNWINLFFERSDSNAIIFKENAALINSVLDYFNSGHATDEDYDKLATKVLATDSLNVGDPLLVEQFMKLLLPHYEKRPDSPISLRARLYRYHASAQYEIVVFGNTEPLKNVYKYYSRVADMADSLPADAIEEAVHALSELSSLVWCRSGYADLEDTRAYKDRLASLLSDDNVVSALSEKTLTKGRQTVTDFDHQVIRNGYLADTTLMSKSVADSMINAQIDEYAKMSHPSVKDICVLNVLKQNRGLVSADKALGASLRFLQQHPDTLSRLSGDDFNRLHAPLLDIIYLNDIADRPLRAKRNLAQAMSRQIFWMAARLNITPDDNRYISILMKLLTYDRLTRYLTPEEKEDFMHGLLVNTQVATAAHSQHVAALAEIILDGVEKYSPHLLPSPMAPNGLSWKDFIVKASLIHDVGKLRLAPLVTNEYRPFTPHERELVRLHPTIGASILSFDSVFEPYLDIVLGHHKWHDGSQGYPESFDNTKSPLYSIIDIVTIADCLEAATDKIGRNYSRVKHFDDIFRSMRAEGGTRYNKEILNLIARHRDIYSRLKEVVENLWRDIYFDIYETYISSPAIF